MSSHPIRNSQSGARGLKGPAAVMLIASFTGLSLFPDSSRSQDGQPVIPASAVGPSRQPLVVDAAAHPIDPALELIRKCDERFRAVRDYTATFVKQELIGEQLTPVNYINAKFRQAPFSAYLQWIQPEAGKEAIYVQGDYDDKIVTHTTGFAKALTGTLKIDPDSATARRGNRHSIRESGIGNLIQKVITRWEYERQYAEVEVEITNVKINSRPCYQVTTIHPVADNGRYMFHTFKLYIDRDEMLPIRMEGYAFPAQPGRAPGPLLESYTYLNLKVNVGLSDIDFSPRNPTYNFARF